ncbi:MAG: ECF transporter S component [Ktedonobacteraceae bacterium]|nr:ECF transporter S component [Ktedonobacteraceae bacterium]
MSKVTPQTTTSGPWAITTERLAIAGVLAAITIILGVVPGIGFFPVPNTTGNATTEHIPTILGGVIGGPIVGIFSGLVFGLVSFLRATSPLFKDPLVAIVPRLFIGLVAWAVFAGLIRVRLNRDVAALIAGVLGSATNTVLVLGIAILRGYIQPVVVLTVLPQATVEAIVAAIITVILARVFYILQKRYVRAPETKSREELPY